MSDSDNTTPPPSTGPQAGYSDRSTSSVSSQQTGAFPKGRLIAALIVAVILTGTLLTAAVFTLKKADEKKTDSEPLESPAKTETSDSTGSSR